MPGKRSKPPPVRFAVVGAGHIAQNAVLPAFANARRYCQLTALISDDPAKRRRVARQYGVDHTYGYDEFDEACQSGVFDAVFIALPNSMHAEFTCRAAVAGQHVLCEKPMAVTSEECQAMVTATSRAGVKLMIAYRLHFEAANLEAVELIRKGAIGEPRFFDSVFSMQVRPGNIRLSADLGGGPLRDIGIYCINAARYLFRDEPEEVTAFSAAGRDERFSQVPEMISAVLRYPRERLASFTCSFGAADVSEYRAVGTKGELRLNPAYEYEGRLSRTLTVRGRTRTRTYRQRDQFAPELIHFAQCIQNDTRPEPSGLEGLADIRIIEAIHQSIAERRPVAVAGGPTDRLPDASQEMHKRPPRKKELVNVESASMD